MRCSGGNAVPTRAEPPIRSSAFNKIYYDPSQTYGVGKKSDATDLPYEKAAIGTWTQVFTNPYANYPNASNSATTNLAPTNREPHASAQHRFRQLPRHDLVLEDDDVDRGLPDCGHRWLGLPSQWPRVQPGDGGRQYHARHRCGLQLSEQQQSAGVMCRVAAMQVRQSLHRLRISVLLHHLTGAVLFGEGWQRLGHDALQQPLGSDDLQVRALRHECADIRSRGVYPRRHHTGGHPGERCGGGQSDRPDLCPGTGQFRQVVRIRSNPHTGDEDRRGHRVFRAGPELARRLQHAEQLYQQVLEHRRLHDREQSDVVHEILFGVADEHDAFDRCHVADRRVFLQSRDDRRSRRRYGSARPGDRKVPG